MEFQLGSWSQTVSHPHTGRWCCQWFPGSYTLYHEMSDYLRSLFRFDKFCFMSWKQFLMWDDHTVGQATCVEVWGIWAQVPSIHVKRVGSGDLCVPRQWIASHLNWMVGSRFCLKLWGGEYLRRILMLTFGLHRQIAHMLHTCTVFSSEWFWLPKIYSILVSIKKQFFDCLFWHWVG